MSTSLISISILLRRNFQKSRNLSKLKAIFCKIVMSCFIAVQLFSPNLSCLRSIHLKQFLTHYLKNPLSNMFLPPGPWFFCPSPRIGSSIEHTWSTLVVIPHGTIWKFNVFAKSPQSSVNGAHCSPRLHTNYKLKCVTFAKRTLQ